MAEAAAAEAVVAAAVAAARAEVPLGARGEAVVRLLGAGGRPRATPAGTSTELGPTTCSLVCTHYPK